MHAASLHTMRHNATDHETMKDMRARVHMDGLASDQWRRYGEARRKELVAADEREGNTKFHLHKKCRIQRYFQLAERVSGTAFGVR